MSDLLSLHADTLEQRAVNTIRVLAMDAVQKANSGHPGLPMGSADLAYVLWSRFLKFDAGALDWPDRDRFVLSGGHGCMLHYALLYLTGCGLTLDDLKAFRQWDSLTPGHPEAGHTPGIETTTGPLGQGISAAVGMAMAEAHLAARLNRDDATVVDHRTWVLATDGDLMEGVQSEAASLAGHLGLGKLNVIYDDNHITIDGDTSLAFSEDVAARYRAYGWHVQEIDGHDRDAISAALAEAETTLDRPSLIRARTHIAFGSPHKQDSADAHGSPLGPDEVKATKEVYGWPADEAFVVPEDVLAHYREMGTRHRKTREAWEATHAAWRKAHPELAEIEDSARNPRVPEDAPGRPAYEPGAAVATRNASGKAIAWVSKYVPSLWGGSADLAPSNKTLVPNQPAFSREARGGRNLHFGIREHAMAATLNGMANHGGIVPYGGTFLVFSDYLRPSLRLAGLMGLRVIHVFTHDSIFLGEDGPTHQPEAHLAALRAMPGVTVIRPMDAEETTRAWEVALARTGPTALVLTRQDLPVLDRAELAGPVELERGAYLLLDPPGAKAVVFATGSEVEPALTAARNVTGDGIPVRVVAVPSFELFAEQDEAYRAQVLGADIPVRMAVEAASPFGWERFVGLGGTVLGLEGFGASAPAEVLAEKFGFTAEAVERRLREILA